MILTIYLVLLGLAALFITLGLWADNPVLSIMGCGLLFSVGATMMLDSLEYKDGMTITDNGLTQTIVYTYATYTNRTLGLLIMLTGFAGIFLTFLDMWRARQ